MDELFTYNCTEIKNVLDFKLHNIESIDKKTEGSFLFTDLTLPIVKEYKWKYSNHRFIDPIKDKIFIDLLKKASDNIILFYKNCPIAESIKIRKKIINMPVLRHISIVDEHTMIKYKRLNPIIDIFNQRITEHNGFNNLGEYKHALNNIKPITIREYTTILGYAYNNYNENNYTKEKLDSIKLCENAIHNFKIAYRKDKELLNKANQKFKQRFNFIPTPKLIDAELPKIVLYHELGHVFLGAQHDNPDSERDAQKMASIFARNTLDSMLIEYVSYFQPTEYQNAKLWGLDFYE